MSTDTDSRRARARRRRGRTFAVAFAAVVGILALVGAAGAAVTVLQGPRLTDVQVDPAGASAASGSRVILTTTQSLHEIDPSQVEVEPAAAFTVDTAGRSVGVRFTLPLYDDTDYTVTVRDVEGLGGGGVATLTTAFRTPPLDVFLLQRGDDGDTVFRTGLDGEEAVAVFSHPHIEDFRATATRLVVSVVEDDVAALVVVDHDGDGERRLPVPGDGIIANLQGADRGDTIGYTYSDATLGAEGGRESVLYTASVKDAAADEPPTEVAVAGEEGRVDDWRFVPDTDSILLLTFDSRLLLTGAAGGEATVLGNAVAIDGIAPGANQAVVERADGAVVIDLADGAEAPLVEADAEYGLRQPVLPIPGSGTLRRYAELDASGTVGASVVVHVADDGASRVVFTAPATDAVQQTCVAPSGRYAAVLVAPDAVANAYDRYLLPLPETLVTHIVDLGTGDEVVALSGFDLSWCRVPPA